VAVTLISRRGYFTQQINNDGWQEEHPADWNPADFMELLPARVTVPVEGREVVVRAWQFDVLSPTGGVLPILYLDTSAEENDERDRGITDTLYGGDRRYRLKQEIVLGLGGCRMLEELGVHVKKYHMNEGHASLLTVDLLRRHKQDIERVWDESLVWNFDAVRDICMFTTHTPVEAGHDHFEYDLVQEVLGEPVPIDVLKQLGGSDELNMTLLALNLSSYVNGVAKKHGEVSQEMFRGYAIHSITNGIHSFTWTSEPFKELFDQYIPGWANEPELFVRVDNVPDEAIWSAHQASKKKLMNVVLERTGVVMDPDVLTIGFARRAATYKRADLLFRDMERLRKMGKGRLQIVYAGKAHPQDQLGKEMIQRVIRSMGELGDDIETAYLPGMTSPWPRSWCRVWTSG